jgi:hypothetical protein
VTSIFLLSRSDRVKYEEEDDVVWVTGTWIRTVVIKLSGIYVGALLGFQISNSISGGREGSSENSDLGHR